MCCSEQLPAGLDAVPPPDLGLGPHANDGQAAGEGPCHGAAVQDTLQRTEGVCVGAWVCGRVGGGKTLSLLWPPLQSIPTPNPLLSSPQTYTCTHHAHTYTHTNTNTQAHTQAHIFMCTPPHTCAPPPPTHTHSLTHGKHIYTQSPRPLNHAHTITCAPPALLTCTPSTLSAPIRTHVGCCTWAWPRSS